MHGPVLRLIGEPVKPCTPYQNNHHQQTMVMGLGDFIRGWLHCEGVVLSGTEPKVFPNTQVSSACRLVYFFNLPVMLCYSAQKFFPLCS